MLEITVLLSNMSPEKIKELKKRQALLQEKVRLKLLSDQISHQINYLEREGFTYVVFAQFEWLDWLYAHVPIRKKDGYFGMHEDYQIDVDDATAQVTVELNRNELVSPVFSESVLAVIPSESDLVISYLGGAPEYQISVAAFLSNPLLFLSRFENWAITTDRKFIIEHIAEQQVLRLISVEELKLVLVVKIVLKYENRLV